MEGTECNRAWHTTRMHAVVTEMEMEIKMEMEMTVGNVEK